MATLTATPTNTTLGQTISFAYGGSLGGSLRITRPDGSKYYLPTGSGNGTRSYKPTTTGTFRADLLTPRRPYNSIATAIFGITAVVVTPTPPPVEPPPVGVVLPTGAVVAAAEQGSFVMADAGLVYYGADGHFFSKQFAAGATVACVNGTFGDPIINTPKNCYVVPAVVPPVIVPVPPEGLPPLPTPAGPPPDKAPGALQAILDSASATSRQTIEVPYGRYHETATAQRPAIFRAPPGTLIEADNQRTEYLHVDAPDVEFYDLGTHGAKLGAHQAGSIIVGADRFIGHRLKIDGGPASILKFQNSKGHRLFDCEVFNGPESLFSFNKANDVEFHGGSLHHALGTWPGFDAGDEGGIGKFGGYSLDAAQIGSFGMLFDGVHVYAATGRGLWGDIQANGLTVRKCLIHDITANGVMFEISHDFLMEDSTVYRVGRTSNNDGWGWGGGILSASSRIVTIRRNLVYDCALGISMLSQRRRAPNFDYNPGMRDVQAYENTIIAKNASDRLIGFFQDWPASDPEPFFHGGTNRAYGNKYWHPSPEGSPGDRFVFANPDDASTSAPEQYGGAYAKLSDFMARMGDTTSRYLTVAEKDAALAAAGIA